MSNLRKGDRVKYDGPMSNHNGRVGTVTATSEHGRKITVEFDEDGKIGARTVTAWPESLERLAKRENRR